jgi:cell division septation protein DedD
VRDVERLREKIELSLDDRQVIALAVCALLLLGGVFSLGILLGKKLSSMQAPAAAPSDLASLDAQARNPGPAPAPARATPHPETPARPAAVAPAEKAHELTVKPEQARLASVVAPPRQTTVVPPPPARAAQLPPAALTALTVPPRDLGEFTVQVGASQDRTEAARLEARARGAGLKPYLLEANLGAKGTWYRVRVGAFRDKDAASRFRTDVERELRSAAVVMTTH